MNSLNIDLTGKTVMVNGKKFKAESGFGCKPDTSGQKIFGVWVDSNESGMVSGFSVEALAK